VAVFRARDESLSFTWRGEYLPVTGASRGIELCSVGPLRRFDSIGMTKTFAELNFPGRLIAVEGLDGSGKSTQIHLLKRWLELQGAKVFFSEWNSSVLVKSATSKGKSK